MKRLAVLFLVMLAGGVLLGEKLQQDPGYFLLAYKNQTVESSLLTGVVIMLSTMAVLYVSFWVLFRILGIGTVIREWRSKRQNKRSAAKTTKGMMDLIEGNWAQAQKKLSQAANKSQMPLINYLAAARAAAANDDIEAAEAFLNDAAKRIPEAEVAAGITKAELQIEASRHEEALATLLQLRGKHPKHKHVLNLLHKVYVELEDWPALDQLLPVLRKQGALKRAEIDDLRERTTLVLLQRAVREQSDSLSAQARADRLRQAWNDIPVKARRNANLVLAYLGYLKELGRVDWAEAPLRDAIKDAWNEDLVAEYGMIDGAEAQHQLLTAEGWLKKHADSAVLLLALGRISLRSRLWGKAKEYFAGSLKIDKIPEAYAELGRLLAAMGEDKQSIEIMKEGFGVMTESLPQLPQPENEQLTPKAV